MKRLKRSSQKKAPRRVECIPSHTPFAELISYCTRGETNRVLKATCADYHIDEILDLYLDDTTPLSHFGKPSFETKRVRDFLWKLDRRIHDQHDLKAAELMFAIATTASWMILELYLCRRDLFCQITPRRKLLPCFASIHPKTAKVMARMLADARLGSKTEVAAQVRSKAFFVSDKPANIYARAIIHYVFSNQFLDPIAKQQRFWRSFDRENGIKTILLPFPKHLNGIEQMPYPVRPDTVLQYWRKGKEVILQEMPDFHLRPEWAEYHERHYQYGAKRGAIQHAIFKDILAALRTIAGANRHKVRS